MDDETDCRFDIGGPGAVACTQKSAYDAAVEDMEPVYYYKSLAGVQCYQEPSFRDERRMVNYFGPPPRRFGPPKLVP